MTPWEAYKKKKEQEANKTQETSTTQAQGGISPWEAYKQQREAAGLDWGTKKYESRGPKQRTPQQRQTVPVGNRTMLAQQGAMETAQRAFEPVQKQAAAWKKYRAQYDSGRNSDTVQAEYQKEYERVQALEKQIKEAKRWILDEQGEAMVADLSSQKTAAEARMRALAEEAEYANVFRYLDDFGALGQRENYAALSGTGQRLYETYQKNAAALNSAEKRLEDVNGLLLNSTGDPAELAKLQQEKTTLEGRIAQYANYAEDISMLSEEQKQDYYYLLATDPAKAAEYYAIIRQGLNQEKLAGLAEWSGRNFWTRTAASLASTALLGGAWTDPIAYAEDPYALRQGQIRDTMRAGAAQGLTEKGVFDTGLLAGSIPENVPVLGGQNLGSVYQLGQSMADSGLASTLGPVGGSLVLGGAAMGSAFNEAIDKGVSYDRALVQGLAQGVAEMFFEKFSLENLVNNDVSEGALKTILKQAGVEASEELMTSIANQITDRAIMQDLSAYNTAIQENIRSGMSATEAREAAERSIFNAIVQDALGGAISGAGMAGTQRIAQNIQTKKSSKTAAKYLYSQKDTAEYAAVAKAAGVEKGDSEAATLKKLQKYYEEVATGERSAVLADEKTARAGTDATGAENAAEGEIRALIRGERYEAAPEDRIQTGWMEQVEQSREMHYQEGMELEREALEAAIRERAAMRDDAKLSPTAREANQYILDGYGQAWEERFGQNEEARGETEHEMLSDDGGQWDEGLGAGGQAGTVAEGTAAEARQERKGDGGQNGVQSLIDSGQLERTSAAEAGVIGGSTEQSLYIIPAEAAEADAHWAPILRRAEAKGASVVLFAGDLIVTASETGKPVMAEGLRQENPDGGVTIYVKVDGRLRSAEQVYQHEEFHELVAGNMTLMQTLARALEERYGRQEIAKLVRDYISAYRGVYGTFDDCNSGAEENALILRYLEEAFADVYAGIRRGHVDTRKAGAVLKEQSQNLSNRATAGENAAASRRDGREAEGPRLSIERTTYNQPFVEVEEDILAGVPREDWVSTVKENLKEKFPSGITVGNDEIWIDGRSRKEMTYSKYMQWLYNNDPQLQRDKLRATNNADEILHATTGWVNEGMNHTRKDGIVDFARGTALLRVGQNDYTADVVVGMRKNGRMIMYDVLNLQKTSFTKREEDAAISTNPSPGAARSTASFSANSVQQRSENVKQKYSPQGGRSERWKQPPMNTGEFLEREARRWEEADMRRQEDELDSVFHRQVEAGEEPAPRHREAAKENDTVSPEEESAGGQRTPEAEEYYEKAREEKQRQAARASTAVLKNRIKRCETDMKTQRAAMEMMKKAGQLTKEIENSIWRKMDAIRDTLEVTREELAKREKIRKQVDREAKKKKEERTVAEQKAKTAQREIRTDLLNLFSVKPGMRQELGRIIDQITDDMVRGGVLDNDTRRALFEALYQNGEELVFDQYYKGVNNAVRGGKIYVPEEVRREFGGEWETFRKRAWDLRVYLTGNRQDMGIEQWTEELRNTFHMGFDGTKGLKTQLEAIVNLAKEGKGQKLTLAEMMARNRDEYGWSIDEQMEDLERKVDRMLETFAQKAELEIRLRQESVRKLISDHEYFRNILESQQQRRMEGVAREQVMKRLRRLEGMVGKASPAQQKQIRELLGDLDTLARSITPTGLENLQELRDAYDDLKKTLGENFLENKEVEEILDRLRKSRLDELSIEEVRALGKAVTGLMQIIRESGQMLTTKRREFVADVAERCIGEIAASAGSEDSAFRKYNLMHMDGKRLFGQLGGWANGAMEELGRGLQNGQEKMMHYQMDAMRIFDSFLENKQNAEWVQKSTGKKAQWELVEADGIFKVVDGQDVKVEMIELTPMMKVSLLMHSRNRENLWHIGHYNEDLELVGGIRMPNKKYWQKGDMENAYARGETLKMTPAAVRQIAESCTAQERAFADLLQTYFDGLAKDAINEVSQVIDGYERAAVENYFPIQSDKAFVVEESELIKQDISLTSMGFLRHRTKTGANPIYLMDAAEVLLRNIDQVSKYYGLTLPIRDVKAVLNATYYKANRQKPWSREELNFGRDKRKEGWGTVGGEHMSVKAAIQAKWGKSSLKYVEELLRDLQQTEQAGDMLSKLLVKIRGNYARATISFNLSSVAKQLSSYPAAGTYLDIGSLVKGIIPKKLSGDVKTLEKYSAVYWYRNQGNATMELRDATAQQSFGEKLPLGYGWTQRMDSAITRRLLLACEYQVQKDMGLTPSTQEDIASGFDRYWTEVAKLFNTVVLNTQSNSSVMERAKITRANAGSISRFLTMFRTDAFQQYNILVEATGRLRAARRRYQTHETAENRAALKAARKGAAKAYTSVLTAQLSVTLISSLVRMFLLRDDDYREEDGSWSWKKFLEHYGRDVLEGFAGFFVLGDTVYSAIEAMLDKDETWYDISVNSLDVINDAMEFFGKFGDEARDADLWTMRGLVKEGGLIVSQLLGMPLKNVEKWMLAACKWIAPEWAAEYENFWEETTKADLSEESRQTMEAAIGVILDNRADGLSDEVKHEIARLYMAGGTGAVPTAIPGSVSYTTENGTEVKVELNAPARNEYRETWSELVSGGLPDLLETEEYQRADDKTKAELISTLYSFAASAAAHEAAPEKELKKWVAVGLEAASLGVSTGEYVAFYVTMGDIDGKDGNGDSVSGLAAFRSLEYLQSMGWSDAQEEQIYLGMIASESKAADEAAFRAAGLSWEQTNDVINSMDSKEKRMETICEMNVSDAVKAKAMKVIATENQRKMIDAGSFFGLRMADYTEVLNNADTDGKKGISQDEATVYIREMNLTIQQQAWLWQMVTDGKEGKNNPFSKVWGAEFWYKAHENDDEEEN